ncbi:PAS domain S-box protein [Azonexus sp. IMCC34842]|uniref:PAS domain S-box protein n=1 Tax=Azonexus sp. IMCC34842 TaxID=3420950 RepID=UPI003D0DC56C
MSERDDAFVPTSRQWLVAIAALIVLLGAGLYRIHTLLYHHAHDMAEQQLYSVASLKSWDIKRWLDDRVIMLTQPHDGVIAPNLARLLANGDTAGPTRALQTRLRDLMAANPEFKAVSLYDAAGHQLIGDAHAHPQFDASHRAAVRQAQDARRPVFIDFHRTGETTDDVVLDILAPLFFEGSGDSEMIGYLLFQLDPKLVIYPMINRWPVPSDTAESILARREGNQVVFLSPLRHQAAPPLSLHLSVDTPGLISGKSLRGEGDVLAGKDYRGQSVLGVVLDIPGTDWLLITKMDDSEIYREARRNFGWIAAAAAILLVVLLALGRVFATALGARAREAHYRVLAESGSDVVWLYDLDTQRFIYISPAVERMRGYTVAEAMQQSMQDPLMPESRQMMNDELPKWLARFAAGDQSVRTRHFELAQPCKDGTVIETEAVMTLLTDKQGQVRQVQGISRDITARKRAQEELRKLSLAAEQSPVSIVITDLEATIEYVNEAFVHSSGYPRAEVLGQNTRMLRSGRTPKASYEEMWSNLTRGLPWRGELYNRRKDGSEYLELVGINPIRQPDGRVTHYLAVKEDISERRRIEIALAESEEKFRTIYDTINDAIFLHDASNGRVLDVNAGACRMYGYSREQLLNLDLAKVTANHEQYTPEAALEYIQRAREQGWQSFEWLARDSTGREFWVMVNLKMMQVDHGERVLAVVRDIDSRKHAEEELQHALAEARALNAKLVEAQNQLLQSEKMASIGQLAAGVAHEINNPIGFVSSNLGTLERYQQDIFSITAAYEAAEASLGADAAQLAAVRALKRDRDFEFLKTDIVQLMAESKDGLVRVAKIVRDLKDFSRAGEANSQWADLHQGLDSTLNIVWNELKYKCTVHKEYGDLPPVWCVPFQLNQVFMNLLVNAAHAIPDKGEITLRSDRQGDEVFIAITDTGSGIAPENLTRIFDPFFTTKPVGKGTGLGLSLAYSIVQKHRGRIEVSSELGKGTTFTVWLPIEARDMDAAAD